MPIPIGLVALSIRCGRLRCDLQAYDGRQCDACRVGYFKVLGDCLPCPGGTGELHGAAETLCGPRLGRPGLCSAAERNTQNIGALVYMVRAFSRLEIPAVLLVTS